MSKKTILKVIAAICVVSMCFAMVFTGAVSAESATCTVNGYSYTSGAVDVYVGYEVTFSTTGAAFTAGSFEITSHTGLRFVDCTAKASSVNGYVPNVYLNVGNDKVLFAGFGETATNDIQSFTSLTLLLKFTPDIAIKDAAAGTTWPITIGNINITNTAEATYSCDNVTASGSARAHVHNFGAWSGTGAQTRTCAICSAKESRVEPGETLGSNNLANKPKQATLSFTADGDTVLNALVLKDRVDDAEAGGGTTYFVYKYKDDDAEYKYATTTSVGTYNDGVSDYYVFPCGRNGGIGRMSRDITGNFIVVKSGASTISKDWTYSIKDYLESVIDYVGASDATVNYAKALWNYGYYTTKYLNEVDQPGSFADDLEAYDDTVQEIADWGAFPGETGITTTGSGSWKFKKAAVQTGYKPKMHITLDTAGTALIKAYNTTGDLVYQKSVQVTANEAFIISDIPTKYLTGTITVKLGSDSKVVTYSFGKYAKARMNKSAADANIFKWMMNYAHYLGQAFA